jgi:hypothetical protein
MNKIRNLIIGSLLVVLILPTSLVFAAGSGDFKGVNYAHCAETEFVQAKSRGFSGDDLYDSAADLTGEEINYAANFPCEEASADQHGSGTISSDDAIVGMDPDDVVAYDWARFFGNRPLENLNDADDLVAYDWARFFGYEPLENLKDADDVVAYDWARFFGNKPLENLTHTDDVVAYDWARFFGNGPLSTK